MAFNLREFAEKNSGEINQVNALINQLAAAGKLRIGAPLLFVADAAALAVTSAHKHHRTEHAAVENIQRLQARRMIAMIVADADQCAGFFRGGIKLVEFGDADAGGFFDENVFAVFHRRQRNRCERGIDRGNHRHVHVRRTDGLLERFRGDTAGTLRGNFFGAVNLCVASDGYGAGRQQIQPLLSDEAAADECNA